MDPVVVIVFKLYSPNFVLETIRMDSRLSRELAGTNPLSHRIDIDLIKQAASRSPALQLQQSVQPISVGCLNSSVPLLETLPFNIP
jgi:non-ribosomal peptide synthetase component F